MKEDLEIIYTLPKNIMITEFFPSENEGGFFYVDSEEPNAVKFVKKGENSFTVLKNSSWYAIHSLYKENAQILLIASTQQREKYKSNLWIYNTNNKELKIIQIDKVEPRKPAILKNKRILFFSSDGKGTILVYDLDNRSLKEILTDTNKGFVLSPDNNYLYFIDKEYTLNRYEFKTGKSQKIKEKFYPDKMKKGLYSITGFIEENEEHLFFEEEGFNSEPAKLHRLNLSSLKDDVIWKGFVGMIKISGKNFYGIKYSSHNCNEAIVRIQVKEL